MDARHRASHSHSWKPVSLQPTPYAFRPVLQSLPAAPPTFSCIAPLSMHARTHPGVRPEYLTTPHYTTSATNTLLPGADSGNTNGNSSSHTACAYTSTTPHAEGWPVLHTCTILRDHAWPRTSCIQYCPIHQHRRHRRHKPHLGARRISTVSISVSATNRSRTRRSCASLPGTQQREQPPRAPQHFKNRMAQRSWTTVQQLTTRELVHGSSFTAGSLYCGPQLYLSARASKPCTPEVGNGRKIHSPDHDGVTDSVITHTAARTALAPGPEHLHVLNAAHATGSRHGD